MDEKLRERAREFMRSRRWNTEHPDFAIRGSILYSEMAAFASSIQAEKDAAYAERDKLVCALSKLFPASLERHPDSDTTWEDDWRWIVFIELPTGQATWHIHDSELAMFNHLQRHTDKVWDGHTTPQKYERLAKLSIQAEARAQAMKEAAEIARQHVSLAKNLEDTTEVQTEIAAAIEKAAKTRKETWPLCPYCLTDHHAPPEAGKRERAAEAQKG